MGELWATERAAVVDKIKKNKWGKTADGTKVVGPEGFTIDLTTCPAGWSDTEGLTDTEIKIGNPTALSGTAADFGNISKTTAAWFEYLGEKGAFTDSEGKNRKVNYIVRDDGYDATRTIPLVDELMDSEKSFLIQTLGTPGGLKVYDKLNERCIPHPFEISGSPAWGDPENHPWTSGSLLSYLTEAVIWGAFIDQNIDELTADGGKVRIAALVAESDFGAAYEGAMRSVIESSPNKDKIEFEFERLPITAPTITDAMTTLASKNPNIFITMTGAVQCTQIINEIANNGMDATLKYKFMSSVCKSSAYVGKDKVGGDGSQSNGWYIVGGGQKDIVTAAGQGDAFSKWAIDFLAEAGHDAKLSSNFGNGFYQAWMLSQTLQIAGELDGGLTRTNFITAMRAFRGPARCTSTASRSTSTATPTATRSRVPTSPCTTQPSRPGSCRATSSSCPASRRTAPGIPASTTAGDPTRLTGRVVAEVRDHPAHRRVRAFGRRRSVGQSVNSSSRRRFTPSPSRPTSGAASSQVP
ncbi:MAG: ABC transporter substrate-binding protein [Acidimicrobiales bacterium]